MEGRTIKWKVYTPRHKCRGYSYFEFWQQLPESKAVVNKSKLLTMQKAVHWRIQIPHIWALPARVTPFSISDLEIS